MVRQQSLTSLRSSGLEVTLITPQNLADYIEPDSLHPSYPSLNLAHRADYLRALFMHRFGGAYCDIKPLSSSWVPAFEKLAQDENLLATGYQEIHPSGIANIHRSSTLLHQPLNRRICDYIHWRWLRLNYKKVIGNGAFIFKANSRLTTLWWEEVNRRLDVLGPLLTKFPAQEPKELMGAVYGNKKSSYPVPWSHLLGDILQPLALRFSARISRDLPPPSFENYQ